MDLFMTLVADRVAPDNVLRKVDALVDWGRVGRVLGPVGSKLGRAGYDVELLVRVLLPSAAAVRAARTGRRHGVQGRRPY